MCLKQLPRKTFIESLHLTYNLWLQLFNLIIQTAAYKAEQTVGINLHFKMTISAVMKMHFFKLISKRLISVRRWYSIISNYKFNK